MKAKQDNPEGSRRLLHKLATYKRTLLATLATPVFLLGAAATVLSFFPKLTVSEPTQMDPTDLFSYQITITNDGVLPVFGTKWGLAPRHIKVGDVNGGTHFVGLIAPEYGEWIFDPEMVKTEYISVGRGENQDQRHAAFVFYPGSELIVKGPATYQFQIRMKDDYIGYLAPGNKATITTEGLITAPMGATYDEVDFAVVVRYTPTFAFLPFIPMQTCANFHMYKDRHGTPHWFRSPDQCDRFPWMHHWFDSNPAPPVGG